MIPIFLLLCFRDVPILPEYFLEKLEGKGKEQYVGLIGINLGKTQLAKIAKLKFKYSSIEW